MIGCKTHRNPHYSVFWETKKPLPNQGLSWWEGLLPSRLRESNPRPIHYE